MLTFPLGLLLLVGTIYLSVEKDSWPMFLNAHAIILVCGGSLALQFFTTPTATLIAMFRQTVGLFKAENKVKRYQPALNKLAANRTGGAVNSGNELIDYAAGMWEQGIEHDLFIVLLSQKKQEIEDRGLDAIMAFKSMSKYPPALGMTGTVVGMIALFAQLGGDNMDNIGPALALAMTATFFGLIVANAFFTPIADRLMVKHTQNKRFYKNIFQLILLINRGEATSIIEEEVKARDAA